MRTPIFCLLCLLAANVLPLFAQIEVHAVFQSDGPFTARCDGSGGLLSDETVVFIFHDWDRDGPDSTDTVMPRAAPDEYPIASFYSFFLDEDGSFTSDLWWCYTGLQFSDITFYLRIFFGDSLDSCYTSPAMTLAADSATYIVSLPRAEWTCEPAPTAKPPCEMGAFTGFYLISSEPDRHEVCIETCPGGSNTLHVLIDNNEGLSRPPAVMVTAGCDTNCRPDSSAYFNPATWRSLLENTIWLINVGAWHRGCATLTFLDSIPCGTLDTITGESQQIGVLLRWNTTREIDLDSFELWRQKSELITTIPAAYAPNGGSYEFLDIGVSPQGNFTYSLVMVASNGQKYCAALISVPRRLSVSQGLLEAPSGFALHPNYPNPFNPSTTISFDLPVTTRASVRVYDIAGREVSVLADEIFSAGTHTITLDGRNLSSGIYICRLTTGQFTTAQKMILLK